MQTPTRFLILLGMAACIHEEDNPYVATEADVTCAGDQGSTGTPVGPVGRIQAVGDSILGWNKESGESIPHAAADILGVPVRNNAVGGATLAPLEDEGIAELYEPGDFTHVLVNGGGNDFAYDCTQEMLDALISADLQSGWMVDLLDTVTADGAQAVIVGYYIPRDYEVGCVHLTTLQQRYRQLGAERADTMYVCTMETIVPEDRSLYASRRDKVHPSPAGSAAIGRLVADHLR